MFFNSFASLKMSCFWTLIILSITFSSYIIEANQNMTLLSAVIIGAVQCDSCIKQSSQEANRFISGVSLAVNCTTPSFHHVVKTNKTGNFEVHLPFSVEENLKQMKECFVELISSNELLCTMAAKPRATLSSLRLKSRKGRKYIFSAGVFKFKPTKSPEICDQKPTSETLQHDEKLPPTTHPIDNTFLPAVQDPKSNPMSFEDYTHLPQLPKLPPLPELPHLPQLPQIPNFPPFPRLPGFQFFRPIPGLPENTFTRPVFMPQFPFQPTPGFPGVSDVSSQSKTRSP